MGSPMIVVEVFFKTMVVNQRTKIDPNGFTITNLEEELKRLEKSLSEFSYPNENFSKIISPSKRSKAQQMKAKMNGEQTKKQIDVETKKRIILWVTDQLYKMAARINPFEKEIIFRYHKMMVVYRHFTDANVGHVATREEVTMLNDVVRTFARLVHAAKTSILKSDGVTDVNSSVQEFDECFKNTMGAIKCSVDCFCVCRKPNEDRILQKILKYIRNPYRLYHTDTELMKGRVKVDPLIQQLMNVGIRESTIRRLKDRRDTMAVRVSFLHDPFEKEIILRYHKMMVVCRHIQEAIARHVVTREDVIMHNEVLIAFAQLVHAAKTSILRSDGVPDVISSVQEFDECIENTMDAIKRSGDFFFVCRKPPNEDRILQKILNDLRNTYEPFKTDGTEELMKAIIKEAEPTQKHTDPETQEKIILCLNDQPKDNTATTLPPSEIEIKWLYHTLMGKFRRIIEAIVLHVASIEDVIMHKNLLGAFAPLAYAAKSSNLISDNVENVISLVQEFDECFENTMDAIKCSGDSFSVSPKPRNEDRILQKILKYLRTPYQSYETETELMKAIIKESEQTQKQIDAETQERIIQWLNDRRDNMATRVSFLNDPFEKEIILRYLKMMEIFRQLKEAVVTLQQVYIVATNEDFIVPEDVVRAFAPFDNAAKTSSMRSNDVISLIQEFNQWFEKTMDAVNRLDDSFFVCPTQWNQDRIIQKTLKILRNHYRPYETNGTKENQE